MKPNNIVYRYKHVIKYYSKKQSNDKHKRVTHEEAGIKMRLGRGTDNGNGNQAS